MIVLWNIVQIVLRALNEFKDLLSHMHVATIYIHKNSLNALISHNMICTSESRIYLFIILRRYFFFFLVTTYTANFT
jgi:hypothetical protein